MAQKLWRDDCEEDERFGCGCWEVVEVVEEEKDGRDEVRG